MYLRASVTSSTFFSPSPSTNCSHLEKGKLAQMFRTTVVAKKLMHPKCQRGCTDSFGRWLAGALRTASGPPWWVCLERWFSQPFCSPGTSPDVDVPTSDILPKVVFIRPCWGG